MAVVLSLVCPSPPTPTPTLVDWRNILLEVYDTAMIVIHMHAIGGLFTFPDWVLVVCFPGLCCVACVCGCDVFVNSSACVPSMRRPSCLLWTLIVSICALCRVCVCQPVRGDRNAMQRRSVSRRRRKTGTAAKLGCATLW